MSNLSLSLVLFTNSFLILYKYFVNLVAVLSRFEQKSKNLELDLVSDRDLVLKSQLLLYQKEFYQKL